MCHISPGGIVVEMKVTQQSFEPF